MGRNPAKLRDCRKGGLEGPHPPLPPSGCCSRSRAALSDPSPLGQSSWRGLVAALWHPGSTLHFLWALPSTTVHQKEVDLSSNPDPFTY